MNTLFPDRQVVCIQGVFHTSRRELRFQKPFRTDIPKIG
ncbi:hypothetical protein DSTSK_37810 [Desulforhabdus sp. TSK]|nr:hypothetical protein DSTSK_37810 [Desulforhabdus sp. TSK]